MDDLTQDFIAESMEGLDRMERCLTDLEVRPGDPELVGEIFRAVHTIKGITGFLGLGRLEKLAHAGESLLSAMRDRKVAVSEALISGLLSLLDGLRHILKLIETTGGEGNRTNDEDSELIRLLTDLNNNRSSALSMETSTGIPEPTLEMPAQPASEMKSLRVGVDVLNRMMNLVGDLVLTRNQILQSELTAANFPELARRLDGITADLRETVMQARMQPVGHIFSKFPRMVRDLARSCGREVRIECFGIETELDKSLLEAIKDPLTHAVRNAVDHGIESPNVRVAGGKPAEGCVRMKAFHQSGFVVIEVSDDGAGIDVARVLGKAVEKKLVTVENAAALSEREALQLIFLAGFSTAEVVTHVSGRGVGMDVVRANVEKVGGRVEIESWLGRGTTLRMRVPLTLAIVSALVVRSSGESFALPQSAIAELVYVPNEDAGRAVERVGDARFYRLRESLLPLVWLDRSMELPPRAAGVPGKGTAVEGFYIAVLDCEGRRYGLVVEQLLTPEEIVVKPLSDALREDSMFSGATVLGNGTMALILDVTEMAKHAKVRAIDVVDTPRDVVEAKAADEGVSLLVFEGRNNERKALLLDSVERIETVPQEEIEYSNGRPVLQYYGELLQLDDEDDVLGEMPYMGHGKGDGITLLICQERDVDGSVERRSGRVVRQVLDVTTGTWMKRESSWASRGDLPIALVNGQVTTVCRIRTDNERSNWKVA